MEKKANILSDSEIRGLADEKKELESTLKSMEQEQYGAGTRAESAVDKAHIKRQIAHIDEQIHLGSPKKISGTSKDKLAKEAKELQDKISQGMPTFDEMWAKRGKSPGSIRKNLMWQKRNAQNIQRWKQIQRQLNPQDPTASSIETFRKPK